MSEYRRWCVPGGTYFFTAVTYGRRPILTTDLGRRCLRDAFESIRQRWDFEIVATVLLPDHLHTVWALPPGDAAYPRRWRRLKEEFTRRYLADGGREGNRSPGRAARGERAIWQRRYWEHTVRDEDDLARCVDYLHWNPCKHGLVSQVGDWAWSTFHRFAVMGEYEVGWGRTDPVPGFTMPEPE